MSSVSLCLSTPAVAIDADADAAARSEVIAAATVTRQLKTRVVLRVNTNMSSSFVVVARATPSVCGRARRVETPRRRCTSFSRVKAGKLVGESWVELSDASYAIETGRELFASGDARAALEEFERALTLPGNGTKRDRAKPAELSNGERQAALYNIASARCALDDKDGALVALDGCFKAGYANPRTYGAARGMRDLDAMWADEDLKLATRTDAFRDMVKKYKVTPNALALQFDFSNSIIGGAVEAVNEKLTPKK